MYVVGSRPNFFQRRTRTQGHKTQHFVLLLLLSLQKRSVNWESFNSVEWRISQETLVISRCCCSIVRKRDKRMCKITNSVGSIRIYVGPLQNLYSFSPTLLWQLFFFGMRLMTILPRIGGVTLFPPSFSVVLRPAAKLFLDGSNVKLISAARGNPILWLTVFSHFLGTGQVFFLLLNGLPFTLMSKLHSKHVLIRSTTHSHLLKSFTS